MLRVEPVAHLVQCAFCYRMVVRMYIVAKILVTAVALLLVARYLPGLTIDGLYTALIASLILGLLNLTVKPVLVILTLPISILTLGLFMFVINAGIFMFAASFIEGFAVENFWVALAASFMVSVISAIGTKFIQAAK